MSYSQVPLYKRTEIRKQLNDLCEKLEKSNEVYQSATHAAIRQFGCFITQQKHKLHNDARLKLIRLLGLKHF